MSLMKFIDLSKVIYGQGIFFEKFVTNMYEHKEWIVDVASVHNFAIGHSYPGVVHDARCSEIIRVSDGLLKPI
jgi:hypothetical protein